MVSNLVMGDVREKGDVRAERAQPCRFGFLHSLDLFDNWGDDIFQ